MIGSGTALADDPVADLPPAGPRGRARRCASCSTAGCACRRPAGSRRTAGAVPTWLFTGADAPSASARRAARAGRRGDRGGRRGPSGQLDLGEVLAALAARGITRVLVEGGAELAASAAAPAPGRPPGLVPGAAADRRRRPAPRSARSASMRWPRHSRGEPAAAPLLAQDRLEALYPRGRRGRAMFTGIITDVGRAIARDRRRRRPAHDHRDPPAARRDPARRLDRDLGHLLHRGRQGRRAGSACRPRAPPSRSPPPAAGRRATRSTSSARCGSATSSAATSCSAMSMRSARSWRSSRSANSHRLEIARAGERSRR